MIIICQIAPWDKHISISINKDGEVFRVGDEVIIKNDLGTDLATIIKIKTEEQIKSEIDPIPNEHVPTLIRRATNIDLEKIAKKNEQKQHMMGECEELIKKHQLPMKLIDVLLHLDGGRITFAFTAASKVDFRELVKDLAQKLHRSIRLHQVGARQEVEITGDIGPCGRSLCCLNFLEKLGNITTDLIFDQQVAHRGVERLSGICGRLKCCLLFEEDVYKNLIKKLPPKGSIVKTPQGQGTIIGWQILKQLATVQIDAETTVEVSFQDITEVKKN